MYYTLLLSVTIFSQFFWLSLAFGGNFFPTTTSELITAINTSNSNSENDIIDLGGDDFNFSSADPAHDFQGPNALPPIEESGFSLTIQNGTIKRDANSQENFRFLAIAASGTVSLNNLTFDNGIGEQFGGAIYSNGVITLITNCIFSNNFVTSLDPNSPDAFGGAIYQIGPGGISNILSSTFQQNTAQGKNADSLNAAGDGNGGAIFSGFGAFIDNIQQTNFTNNLAQGGDAFASFLGGFGNAGALLSLSSNITSIQFCQFKSNQALGGSATASDPNGVRGGGGNGGAFILSDNARIESIAFTSFLSNMAIGRSGPLPSSTPGQALGGAVIISNAQVGSILTSEFESNIAQSEDSPQNSQGLSSGGAFYIENSEIAVIRGNTFSSNQSVAGNSADLSDGTGLGGSFYVAGDSTINTFVNNTMSGNVAENLGGAAFFLGTTIEQFTNSTIYQNSAGEAAGGGGLYLDQATINNFISNIVAQNQDGDNTDGEDIFIQNIAILANAGTREITTASHNIIGTNGGHSIINGLNNNQVGTTMSPLDPMLAALSSNGGFTKTHEPLTGSPAINQGNNPLNEPFDQRGPGYQRQAGLGIEVGAYEVQACDKDLDLDGSCDISDNCPDHFNPSQTDLDGDGQGDVCDDCPLSAFGDPDNDWVCFEHDNCPMVANNDQTDQDADLVGDVCDNCLKTPNPSQIDSDNDGIGDACDPCPNNPDNTDEDNDGVPDCADTCPGGNDSYDIDNNGVPDYCQPCNTFNSEVLDPSLDIDGDGLPNFCDPCPLASSNDNDGDNVCGNIDNCGAQSNPNQLDYDNDGFGDVCDSCTDLDGDGIGDPDINEQTFPNNDANCLGPQGRDNCPFMKNPDQSDRDGDGIGDACDACPNDANDSCLDDADFDLVPDILDNCPNDFNPKQLDVDNDGIGFICDPCIDFDFDGIGHPEYEHTLCSGQVTLPGQDNLQILTGLKSVTLKQNAIDVNNDNCLGVINPLQEDSDKDGKGDACDICPNRADNRCIEDPDDDKLEGEQDNCPFVFNPNQEDLNHNGIGDKCEFRDNIIIPPPPPPILPPVPLEPPLPPAIPDASPGIIPPGNIEALVDIALENQSLETAPNQEATKKPFPKAHKKPKKGSGCSSFEGNQTLLVLPLLLLGLIYTRKKKTNFINFGIRNYLPNSF